LINPSYLQGRRNKKLFWLPAIAPLLSVILSTLIVFLTKADKHGVKIIKHIKRGINPSSVHQLQLNGPNVGQAAKIGLISAIIALTACLHSFFPYVLYFNFDCKLS
jgi:low affinity sulfate transporter 2